MATFRTCNCHPLTAPFQQPGTAQNIMIDVSGIASKFAETSFAGRREFAVG